MPPDSPLQPLLDTEILRSFVAIAETESFTQAAAEVFRTPSALSMQIKRLEQQVGQRLFLREARRVSLTAEGEAMLGYARRLLKLNQEAISHFTAPELEGTVRLGTPDDIGTRILPQVLTQFSRSHPAVQVNVIVGRSADMLKQLDAGKLDLIMVTTGKQARPARGKWCIANRWCGPAPRAASPSARLPCPWRWPARAAPGARWPWKPWTAAITATGSPTPANIAPARKPPCRPIWPLAPSPQPDSAAPAATGR